MRLGTLNRRRSGRYAVGVLIIAVLVMAPAAVAASSHSTRSKGGVLAGKRILVIPYWLDAFNTANTSWIARLLKAEGAAKVHIINPNKDPSKTLNIIET